MYFPIIENYYEDVDVYSSIDYVIHSHIPSSSLPNSFWTQNLKQEGEGYNGKPFDKWD